MAEAKDTKRYMANIYAIWFMVDCCLICTKDLLVWFYNIIPGHDIGLAIIAITIVIKAILYPFSLKSIKAQKLSKNVYFYQLKKKGNLIKFGKKNADLETILEY